MSKQNNMRSLNWRQSGWRSVGWKNSDVTVDAPADSILHWDADIDAFIEQVGGPHAFNHAVLSPQYQRNADGSYSNVGARPAVDVIAGFRGLRSCGAITNLFGGDTSQARAVSLTNGTVYTLHVFGAGTASCKHGTATVAAPLTFTATASESVTFTPTGATYWMLTATSYPLPYVPTTAAGPITQPASNATTTNGSWFALPDGSPLWQALTGQPLTLATRVRMGVGSGDIPLAAILRVLDPSGSGAMQYVYENGAGEPTAGFNGKNHTIVSLSRGSIIRLIGQVNTAGTQFRSGYYLEGTSTAISWSDWAAYTGTLNPSTLYRLMLGYSNAHPMWFNKITAWKKQVTDAEILEAMA